MWLRGEKDVIYVEGEGKRGRKGKGARKRD
jgi:hypothetical protein